MHLLPLFYGSVAALDPVIAMNHSATTTSMQFGAVSYPGQSVYLSTCSSTFASPSVASYTEQQLNSPLYTTMPGTLTSAPELTPSMLLDTNSCSTHSSSQEQYMDLNGFQGMPHLTIAEGLESPSSEGCKL